VERWSYLKCSAEAHLSAAVSSLSAVTLWPDRCMPAMLHRMTCIYIIASTSGEAAHAHEAAHGRLRPWPFGHLRSILYPCSRAYDRHAFLDLPSSISLSDSRFPPSLDTAQC
jgi:hypothetical protein